MKNIDLFLSEGKIYFLIYFYLWFCALFESSSKLSRYRLYYCSLSAFIFSCFIGVRWETGTDWESYKNLFDYLELNWSFLINVYHFDLGYVLFNAFIKLFTDDYTVFLLLNAFVTIYMMSRLIIKISPYPNLSLFLFYSAYMIAQFMGSNRRMMALVFILWAFYYLYKQQKLYYFLFIILAFLFHRSSLICLIALFIPRRMFTIHQTVILLLVSLTLGVSQLPARLIEVAGSLLSGIVNNPIVEKMVFYSENNSEVMASTGNILISTILAVSKRSLFLLFYFYIMRYEALDKLTQYIYNIYIIGFAGYLIFVGSFFQMLTTYFALIEIILIARMYAYVNKGKTKCLVLGVVFFYGILQMVNALSIYPDLYMPYIPFWANIER